MTLGCWAHSIIAHYVQNANTIGGMRMQSESANCFIQAACGTARCRAWTKRRAYRRPMYMVPQYLHCDYTGCMHRSTQSTGSMSLQLSKFTHVLTRVDQHASFPLGEHQVSRAAVHSAMNLACSAFKNGTQIYTKRPGGAHVSLIKIFTYLSCCSETNDLRKAAASRSF